MAPESTPRCRNGAQLAVYFLRAPIYAGLSARPRRGLPCAVATVGAVNELFGSDVRAEQPQGGSRMLRATA